MKSKLLIFGGESTALEINETIKRWYPERFDSTVFVISDQDKNNRVDQITDSEVEDFIGQNYCKYIISFSNHKLRNKFESWMKNLNVEPVNIIDNSAIISESVRLGNGNYIAAYSIISTNAKVGNHNIFNFQTMIGHDVLIGDHVILNPGSKISGNVQIESNVLIGSNSFVFQEKKIGSDTIVDAMTYIDQDIESKSICSSKQLKVYKRVIF